MSFQNVGSIVAAVKEKLKVMVPLAKAQLVSGLSNKDQALSAIKLIVNSQFHDLTPAQTDIIASHLLFEVMCSENQGVANQITALQQAGASQEAINKVVQGSQMEMLIRAFELQTNINRTMHDMQMNIIRNIGT